LITFSFLKVTSSLHEISSSVKTNPHSQVKLVQIHDTHSRGNYFRNTNCKREKNLSSFPGAAADPLKLFSLRFPIFVDKLEVTGEKPELTNLIKNRNKNQEIREHFLTISRYFK